ncbi:MAG TPA: dTDP-4-dehydrorhamnose reductase [Nitrospiria bacterium]|jgi:dTDP-4-dehydrorhamnose reductase|nr:dTDP-4-dehydrorhamnose reductase [Nitrospiria bacterium]
MKIAVTGATGQLGRDIVEVLQNDGRFEVLPLSHNEIEVTDPDSVRKALLIWHPDAVVNCAAFHRVDECEERPDAAFQVNALGALNVARVCAELKALCVYVSTDYVFDGQKDRGYSEEDTPCPVNVYGITKFAGEQLTRQACADWLIVRVASLFGKSGARGKGGNFIEAILSKARAGETLKVVNDIRMSPTYTFDVATALAELLAKRATGVIHLSNDGACTWYELAGKAVDLIGLKNQVNPISSDEFPSKAKRPKNSSIKSERISGVLDRPMRPWQEAMRAYLIEKGYLSDQ